MGFIYRILKIAALVAAILVLTQDYQVFPGAFSFAASDLQIPEDVQETELITTDNQKVYIWKIAAKGPQKKQSVLMFHGNRETLPNFLDRQRWFAEQGINAYALEYRGFGKNSGYPTEQGLYLDAEAAMQWMLKNENLDPKNAIIFGNSLGTGVASYIAQKYSAGTLMLLAPYLSIKQIAEERPVVGYLQHFLWTEFPSYKYIAELKDTCVIDAHGKKDKVIKYHHSELLRQLYTGSKSYTLLTSETAGHSDIFSVIKHELAEALQICLKD